MIHAAKCQLHRELSQRSRRASLCLRFAPALIVSLITVFLAASNAISADRVALVIGNGNYQHNAKLDNPVNDAKAVANSLEKAGFGVILAEDSGHAEMEKALLDFRKAATGAEASWFFFAGHGVQVNGHNYLIPVDADVEAEYQVKHKTLSLDIVLSAMNESGTPLKVVVLDCCRDNPFARSWSRAITRGLGQVGSTPEGTIIAFAAAPGQVALDGDGKNSPFTVALTSSLETPGKSIQDVFNETGRKVKAATKKKQQPWVNSSFFEPFVVLEGAPGSNMITKTDPPAPKPIPAPVPTPPAPSPNVPTPPAPSPTPVGRPNETTSMNATLAKLGISPGGNFKNKEVVYGGPFANSDSETERQVVKAVQGMLHGPGGVTGFMTSQTQIALIRYQEVNQLAVTGRLDTLTVQKLGIAAPGSGPANPAPGPMPRGQVTSIPGTTQVKRVTVYPGQNGRVIIGGGGSGVGARPSGPKSFTNGGGLLMKVKSDTSGNVYWISEVPMARGFSADTARKFISNISRLDQSKGILPPGYRYSVTRDGHMVLRK